MTRLWQLPSQFTARAEDQGKDTDCEEASNEVVEPLKQEERKRKRSENRPAVVSDMEVIDEATFEKSLRIKSSTRRRRARQDFLAP